jgi:hypothetical protein
MLTEKPLLRLGVFGRPPHEALEALVGQLRGFSSIVFFRSEAALRRSLARKTIDVVALDSQEFDSEAARTLERISRQHPHVPVIITVNRDYQSYWAFFDLFQKLFNLFGERIYPLFIPDSLSGIAEAQEIINMIRDRISSSDAARKDADSTPSWSVLSLSMIVGAITVSVTDALPGGLGGGKGFLIGLAGAFIFFSTALFFFETKKAGRATSYQLKNHSLTLCPNCNTTLLISVSPALARNKAVSLETGEVEERLSIDSLEEGTQWKSRT